MQWNQVVYYTHVWDQIRYCTFEWNQLRYSTLGWDQLWYCTLGILLNIPCCAFDLKKLQGVMMRLAKVLDQVAKDWLIIEAPRLWWELSARQALAGSQVKAGEAAIKPQVKPPQMWNESHKFNFLHLQLSIDQHDFMWYQWSHNFCPFGTHYFHFRFAQTPCNAECASS